MICVYSTLCTPSKNAKMQSVIDNLKSHSHKSAHIIIPHSVEFLLILIIRGVICNDIESSAYLALVYEYKTIHVMFIILHTLYTLYIPSQNRFLGWHCTRSLYKVYKPYTARNQDAKKARQKGWRTFKDWPESSWMITPREWLDRRELCVWVIRCILSLFSIQFGTQWKQRMKRLIISWRQQFNERAQNYKVDTFFSLSIFFFNSMRFYKIQF